MRITTTDPYRRWLRRTVLPAAAIGMLALAGCSSSGGSGGGTLSPGNNTAGSAATTVMIRSVSGKSVLTNSAGRTLYESDQENGTVLCKSSACTAIWRPLTVAAGQTPTGPSQLAGRLSTMRGAGEKTQVALDGKPLYTFSFDHGAGQIGGDGQKDSFSDGSFTWHAATAAAAGGGSAPSTPPSTTAPPSSSGGGYNY